MEKLDLVGQFSNRKAIVDTEDFEYLSQFRWHGSKRNRTIYAVARIPVDGEEKLLYLHRVVMKAQKGDIIDHKHGRGLDCRKSQLRIVSHRQNSQNKQKRKGRASSKYKGVAWSESKRLWLANIQLKTINKKLGEFENEIDAAIAYNTGAMRYYKGFARLNEIKREKKEGFQL